MHARRGPGRYPGFHACVSYLYRTVIRVKPPPPARDPSVTVAGRGGPFRRMEKGPSAGWCPIGGRRHRCPPGGSGKRQEKVSQDTFPEWGFCLLVPYS
ncbi:hypothetical protein GCM10007079_27250 [Nocardiopsis terrae]|nr:hypothetical protein GCM10007079_27250 [Nocardiopsis terrae]